MQEIGQQNEKQDDLLDKSGFLKRARLFQSKYRRDILNVPCDIFGNYLKDDDGIAGKNFYDGFDVSTQKSMVKLYLPKYQQIKTG